MNKGMGRKPKARNGQRHGKLHVGGGMGGGTNEGMSRAWDGGMKGARGGDEQRPMNGW